MMPRRKSPTSATWRYSSRRCSSNASKVSSNGASYLNALYAFRLCRQKKKPSTFTYVHDAHPFLNPQGPGTMKSVSCPNRECPLSRDAGAGNIILHGFYQTNSGKRRRYLCRICEKTFCSNTGTPYYRLQHRRATFDEVATLSVEGLNKSAIARVKRIAWNTVARRLEQAAHFCHRFK